MTFADAAASPSSSIRDCPSTAARPAWSLDSVGRRRPRVCIWCRVGFSNQLARSLFGDASHPRDVA
jgi:hypothetical protein